MYGATSTKRAIITDLKRNSGKYLWRFVIPKGCMQNCSISALSNYKNEGEVLLVPYTAIRVTKIQTEPSGVWIHAEVLADSKAHALDLKTIVV